MTKLDLSIFLEDKFNSDNYYLDNDSKEALIRLNKLSKQTQDIVIPNKFENKSIKFAEWLADNMVNYITNDNKIDFKELYRIFDNEEKSDYILDLDKLIIVD